MAKAEKFFECRYCGVLYVDREAFEVHEGRCATKSPPPDAIPVRDDLVADPERLPRRFDP